MENVLRSRIDAWLARPGRDHAVNEHASLAATVGTARGCVRAENQDRAVIVRFTPKMPSRAFLLFSLCDGLGGMQDGARCACLALAELVSVLVRENAFEPEMRLLRAVSSANNLLAAEYQGRGGTTLSAVLVAANGQAWGSNVGDSRIYAYTPDCVCEQISVDDTIAGQVQRIRGLSSVELDRTHFSDHLAQYVGIGQELESHSFEIDLTAPDAHCLLTSDGAHRPLSKTLPDLAIHAPSPHDLVRRILYFSECTGGLDNASVIAFRALPTTGWSVKPHNPNLVELWDPYSKFELVAPPDRRRRNPGLHSNRLKKTPDTKPIAKKTDAHPRQRKEGVQQRETTEKAQSKDESTKQSRLDIAVYRDDDVARPGED